MKKNNETKNETKLEAVEFSPVITDAYTTALDLVEELVVRVKYPHPDKDKKEKLTRTMCIPTGRIAKSCANIPQPHLKGSTLKMVADMDCNLGFSVRFRAVAPDKKEGGSK